MKSFFLCFLLHIPCCYTGSHSLWIMGTYISGKTPFPEFTGYMMLDDIVFVYYDSNGNQAIHRDIHNASDRMFDADDIDYVANFQYLHGRVQFRLSIMKKFLNNTDDIAVFQRVVGCELLDNDHPGPMFSIDGYNGETLIVDHYDADQDALRLEWKWQNMHKTWVQQVNLPLLYKIKYPHLIKYLRKHLAKEKHRVLKKVKPRVRLLQKTFPDSGGAKVTCLATGFYPRHINLTLLRDGQPVSDHQITGGELLPNGDETYQMRKSLEVSAEELQHHHYTCTAEHLGLDNKLDISLEPAWELGTTVILSSVPAVAMYVCLVGAICVIWWWRRRKGQGSQASELSTYLSTPNTDLD